MSQTTKSFDLSVPYFNGKAIATKSTYTDGNLALFINSNQGEPLATISINYPDGAFHLKENEIFVKNFGANKEMYKELIKAEIIYPTSKIIQINYIYAEICKILF